MTNKLILPMAVFVCMAAASSPAQKMTDGEELIRAMHDRYEKSWYHTITFSQKSTTFNPDGSKKVENWFEAALLPARLRIDFGPPKEGNGAILDHDHVSLFHDGKLITSREVVNFLLVLGFDVYCQPPEVTIEKVRQHGFDLQTMHEELWQGKPAYVVGAAKGDLRSSQFWVDKDRLLFLRIIQPREHDPGKLEDTRFSDYRRMGGGWVAIHVDLFVDGQRTFSEYYSGIRINEKLDPAIFDPAQFTTKHWEK